MILFRHLWGQSKREELLETASQDGTTLYQKLEPTMALGLPFMPGDFNADYPNWPSLPELFPVSFPGVKTSRDDALVDIDKARLVKRMESYFDLDISDEDIRRMAPSLVTSSARFNAKIVRSTLLERGFSFEKIVRYSYRPLDVRWLYWEPETKLLDEKRSEYFPHVFKGNIFLVSQQKPRREWSQPQVISDLGCLDLKDRGASCIPLYLKSNNGRESLFDNDSAHGDIRKNISQKAADYLSRLVASEEDLFYHSLACMHALAFRNENLGALKQDWPRTPLPNDKTLLLASASLGRNLSYLLNTVSQVQGVDTGKIRPELRSVASAARAGGGSLNPDSDLKVTASWGHIGKAGITMPGKGEIIERQYTDDEIAAIREGAEKQGLTPDHALAHLGESTCDIYLNDIAYWKNIPTKVWNYRIGGYQVIKKWLSYRESKVLGRSLTVDEVREVTNMARRIAAILLLEPALDENYERVKSSTYDWNNAAK